MKTKIWFLALTLAVAFTWSCRQGEVDTLKGENSKLLTETLKKDSTINMLFQAFNEIEENLEVIKAKQNMISADAKGNPEMGQNVRDRINDDITSINDLMDKNKRTIASLRECHVRCRSTRRIRDHGLKIIRSGVRSAQR